MRLKLFRPPFLAFLVFSVTAVKAQKNINFQLFSDGLDSIRTTLKIPGMQVAVRQGDSVILERGFGFANLENRIKVTPSTTFRIASITKTFTSTIVMQLVEKGKLDLETPITSYSIDFGNPKITVRQLFTHTSEEDPGTRFQYNGFRFGKLETVIETASGMPFFQSVLQNIEQPLGMASTAPGTSLLGYFEYVRQNPGMKLYFENAYNNLAQAYEINAEGEPSARQYLDEYGAFGGIVSNARDLLKYSAAIDRNQLVSKATQARIFSPNRTKQGDPTPYGLGWFIQRYNGIDFFWHYGQSPGESGLFIKVPSKKMTVVVLANMDRLSTPFPLGDGDLFASPVGQLLYKYVINEDKNFTAVDYNQSLPQIKKAIQTSFGITRDFYKKEIITQAILNIIKHDSLKAIGLYKLYGDLNFTSIAARPKGNVIAEIRDVGISKEYSRLFTLDKPATLRVYAVGENCSGDFKTWCDYGWIEDANGTVVWQMQGQYAEHAGGAAKNQRIDTGIDLPAGNYKLKFKSDSGHAYNSWDSAPPDNFFWGIILMN